MSRATIFQFQSYLLIKVKGKTHLLSYHLKALMQVDASPPRGL